MLQRLIRLSAFSFALGLAVSQSVAEENPSGAESRIAALEQRLAAIEGTDAGPTTAPANVQLRVALAKIKDLEQKVRKLEAAQVSTDPPAKSTKAPAAEAVADALVANANGRGEYYNHNSKNPVDATVNVSLRDGNRALLQVVRPDTGESFQVAVVINDARITVKSVEQTIPPRMPNGGLAPKFIVNRLEGGGGSITDGVLNLTWSIRGSSPPALANNREWHVTLRNIQF